MYLKNICQIHPNTLSNTNTNISSCGFSKTNTNTDICVFKYKYKYVFDPSPDTYYLQLAEENSQIGDMNAHISWWSVLKESQRLSCIAFENTHKVYGQTDVAVEDWGFFFLSL